MNEINNAKTIFFDVDDTLYDHLQPLRGALQDVLGLPDDSLMLRPIIVFVIIVTGCLHKKICPLYRSRMRWSECAVGGLS